MPTLPNPLSLRTAARLAAVVLVLGVPACAVPALAGDPGTAHGMPPLATSPADGLQPSAPSVNSASPDLLDRAGLPRRAALAWDERVQEGPDDRTVTMSLGGAALSQLFHRSGGEDGWSGERGGALSRFAARVSVGGPLQFIGAGRAGNAERSGNHVTSELKVRLAGPPASRPGRPVFALALDADNFATGYGLDRYVATLVAERPGATTWVGNAGWRVTEKYRMPHRLDEAKLGLGAHRRLLGRAGPVGELDLGASGAVLVRNRGRPAVWQGGFELGARFARNLRAGLALRISSAPEMPDGERDMGIVSLSADLGPRGR